MKLFDKIQMCLRNLWRRKMRTFLTTFGVVIGTSAIVVMISLGVGMDLAQQKMLEGMGNLTLIEVYEGWDYEYMQEQQTKGIQLGDPPKLNYDALVKIKQIPHVKAATPMDRIYQEGVLQVGDRYRFSGSIIGIDMASMEGLGYTLDHGRFPSKAEYKDAVVIGSQINYDFIDTKRKRDNRISPFPDQYGRIKDPFVNLQNERLFLNIGEQEKQGSSAGMRIMGGGMMFSSSRGRSNVPTIPTKHGKYPLRVLGTLAAAEEEEINREFDKKDTIYMDISRVQEIRKEYNKKNKIRDENTGGYSQVYVMADSMETVVDIQEYITRVLGYSAWSLSSQRESMQAQTRTIQLILGGLAGISLLVAALGITNTMVMSIYERTREIGIMKVLGCVVGNIRTVFLMEAGCIGLLGGVLGVGISYAISLVLNIVLNGAAGGDSGNMMGGMYGWDQEGMTQYSIIPPWLVVGAMAFAICVGLISGFSPANRAVKISALEAIKHE